MAHRRDELVFEPRRFECAVQRVDQLFARALPLGDVANRRDDDAVAVDLGSAGAHLDRERASVGAAMHRLELDAAFTIRVFDPRQRIRRIVQAEDRQADQLLARAAVGTQCRCVRLDDRQRFAVGEQDDVARDLGEQTVPSERTLPRRELVRHVLERLRNVRDLVRSARRRNEGFAAPEPLRVRRQPVQATHDRVRESDAEPER